MHATGFEPAISEDKTIKLGNQQEKSFAKNIHIDMEKYTNVNLI